MTVQYKHSGAITGFWGEKESEDRGTEVDNIGWVGGWVGSGVEISRETERETEKPAVEKGPVCTLAKDEHQQECGRWKQAALEAA